MIEIHNWYIYRQLGCGYDPIMVEGDLCGHPTINHGSPSVFLRFDTETGIGNAKSGRTYRFDRLSFRPTGFAKTSEEAFEWIQKNWVLDMVPTASR